MPGITNITSTWGDPLPLPPNVPLTDAERGIVGARHRHLHQNADQRAPLLSLSTARYVLLTAGWAARQRVLPEGQRQFIRLILPGDIILRRSEETDPLIALTALEYADWPHLEEPERHPVQYPTLARVLADQIWLDEQHLANQTTRLGRMTALQRMAHLFLETEQRLASVGMSSGGVFDMPLTQETIGDLLGLSVVHVNRTLQTLRAMAAIRTAGRKIWLDLQALAALCAYLPLRGARFDKPA